MAAEHSPPPWHIENEPMNVWDGNGCLVARVNCPLEPETAWTRGCANAALIVRAVNAHAGLLAACEAALARLELGYRLRVCMTGIEGGQLAEEIAQVKEAIAKARTT